MSKLGKKLIKSVRKFAAKKPDFQYRPPGDDANCVYLTEDLKPSCLIGHALHKRGLLDSEPTVTDNTVSGLARHYGWKLDADELRWLGAVQRAQDDGYSWGEAVSRADGR